MMQQQGVQAMSTSSKEALARGRALGCALFVASVICVSGCGGEKVESTDGGGDVPYDACQESQSLEKSVIADFDSATLATFYSSNDGTPGAVFTPGVPTEVLEAPRCDGGAATDTAFHFVGTGFQSYGYSFGFNALGALPGSGGATYFDAGEWSGISMWVRKGSGPSASSIFASVSERYTDPSGGNLFSAAELDSLLEPGQCPVDQAMGGPCYCAFIAVDVNGDQTVDPLQSQCDRFGAGVGIATDWRFFKIPFARMRQRAYGRPSPAPAPDPLILAVEIGLDGENWDFWIDDLAFYRDPAVDAVAGSP